MVLNYNLSAQKSSNVGMQIQLFYKSVCKSGKIYKKNIYICDMGMNVMTCRVKIQGYLCLSINKMKKHKTQNNGRIAVFLSKMYKS